MMGSQQVFDTVARHLMRQRRKSTIEKADGSTRCMYRGPDGLKCAIGCLIPDKAYIASMEGQSVSTLIGWFMGKGIPEFFIRDADMLEDLLRVHDQFNIDQWAGRLAVIALEYDLEFRAEEYAS